MREKLKSQSIQTRQTSVLSPIIIFLFSFYISLSNHCYRNINYYYSHFFK